MRSAAKREEVEERKQAKEQGGWGAWRRGGEGEREGRGLSPGLRSKRPGSALADCFNSLSH